MEDRETVFGATTFGGTVKGLLLDDKEVPTMPRDVKAVERDNRMEEIRKFLADGERGESWGGMMGRQVAKMVTKYFVQYGALWRKRMVERFQKVVQGVGWR